MPRVILRMLAIIAPLTIACSVGLADPITLNYRLHFPARSIYSPAEHYSDPFELRTREINSNPDAEPANFRVVPGNSRKPKSRLAGWPGGYKPVLELSALSFSPADVFDGFIQRQESTRESVEQSLKTALAAPMDRQWFVLNLSSNRRQADVVQPERLSFQPLVSGGLRNVADRPEILTAAMQSRDAQQITDSSADTATNRSRVTDAGSFRLVSSAATATPAIVAANRDRDSDTASDNRSGSGARSVGTERQREPGGNDGQNRSKPVSTPEIKLPQTMPVESSNVPEPATMILLGSGLALLAAGVRRKFGQK